MKTKIANTFYDKGILVMTKTVTRDSEGGLKTGSNKVNYKFYGNVNFSNFGAIQEQYGLDYKIDISITADNETNISINDMIKYNNIVYNVTDVLPTDSHILIVAVKWRQ